MADDPPPEPGAESVMAADPSRLGWDAGRLDSALDAAEEIGLAAVMVIDDGRLVAARGCTRTRWHIASVRKSLAGAAIRRAVAEGRLTLGATLADLGIDDDPPLNPHERQTDLETLLTASSGISGPAAAGSPRCTPGETERGALLHTNWDFNALWTVHERAESRTLFEAFEQGIAGPTGIDSRAERDRWLERIGESRHPADVMQMTAEDMARFGLLYPRGGAWGGRQIVARDWVAASTRPQIATGEGEADGHLWWVQTEASPARPGLPPGTASAEGTWTQGIAVVPDRRLVLVIGGDIPRYWLFDKPSAEEVVSVIAGILAAGPEAGL